MFLIHQLPNICLLVLYNFNTNNGKATYSKCKICTRDVSPGLNLSLSESENIKIASEAYFGYTLTYTESAPHFCILKLLDKK